MVDDRPARPAAERTVGIDDDRVRVSAFVEIELKDGGFR